MFDAVGETEGTEETGEGIKREYRVGDKVTLADCMYDKSRWRYKWVTEARGLVGVVNYATGNGKAFQISWIGLPPDSHPNGAVWDAGWVKYLGSTVD